MTNLSRLPVVCDCCRAEGLAGEDPFEAFGALLDFEPVPRRKNRADGWDCEVQRAYIAALSLTGSKRQAARAVGKAAFGVDQLLEAEGSESFRAAHDEAMAMAADERSRRLAEGVRAIAAEQAGRRPADPPWSRAASRAGRPPAGTASPPPDPGEAAPPAPLEIGVALERMDDEYLDLLISIVRKYRVKLEAERRCRLEGRIAEADFYLRQITMLEVSMDVVSGNGMEVLRRARLGDYGLLTIAETGMSVFLDGARRQYWDEIGDPPRPEHPPRHLLEQKDGFATEPLTTSQGFYGEGAAEKRAAIDEQCARDAEAHIAWEAEALRDWQERHARQEAEASPSPCRGSADTQAFSGGEGPADGEAPPGAEGEGPEPGSS